MKNSIIIFLFLVLNFGAKAQELNCQVSIVPSNKVVLTTVDQEVLEQLEEVMRQFMNETKWTKDNFKLEERINCQIQFQVQKIPQPGIYEGMLQVQSSRPVYNSSYNTLLINQVDKDVTISFARNTMINYTSSQYRDNLTSLLAFYAYYIIGMDYDSFGLKSGAPYFQEAQNIVLNAQSSGAPGWSADQNLQKNNRFYIIENALHQLFEPLRECVYEYHRYGLDRMFENKDQAYISIYEALNKLAKVAATRPSSFNVNTFLGAKITELKQIYKEAPMADKTKLVALLKRLDPTNSEKFDEILK